MNTTTSTQDWRYDTASDTQARKLHGPYWAEIWRANRGWAWVVQDGIRDQDDGWTPGEAEAKEAVTDWAESDLLVAQMTAELLSEAFSAYGHTDAAVARAALAVAATRQIAS